MMIAQNIADEEVDGSRAEKEAGPGAIL